MMALQMARVVTLLAQGQRSAGPAQEETILIRLFVVLFAEMASEWALKHVMTGTNLTQLAVIRPAQDRLSDMTVDP